MTNTNTNYGVAG